MAATTSSHYSLDLGYDPATQQLDGSAAITIDSDAGPRPVQPRPARLVRTSDGSRRGRQEQCRLLPRRTGRSWSSRRGPSSMRAARTQSTSTTTASRRRSLTRTRASKAGWKTSGRRVRGQRAAGRSRLVPRKRRPQRQGDLRLRDYGARRARSRLATAGSSPRSREGGKTTWRWREDSPMASYLTTATNGDFDFSIQTRPQRPADLQRDRLRRVQRDPEGHCGRALRRAAGDHLVLLRALRPVPVHERRRGDRPRRRRLRAGVADEADVRRRAEPRTRSCTSSRTSGSATA